MRQMTGAISEEMKAALIVDTRDRAAAAGEDIDYLRKMASRPKPTADEIRRASSVLRRLLIDNNGDLRKIAAPRIGRFHLLGPDISVWQRSIERQPITLCSSGTVLIGEVEVSSAAVEEGVVSRELAGFDSSREVLLSLDVFLSQGAINFGGRWISRRDVIKHVANVANGVHSGTATDPVDQLLRKARHAISFNLTGGIPALVFNPAGIVVVDRDIAIDRESLDIALLQLITAVQYLVRSPDIIRLEEIIAAETALNRLAWRNR